MSMKVKITGGFIAVLFIFAVAAGIIYQRVDKIITTLETLQHNSLRHAQLSDVQYNAAMQIASIRGFLYYKQDSFVDDFNKYTRENARILQELISTARNESNREKYQKMLELLKKFDSISNDQVIPLIRQGKEQEAVTVARTEGLPVTTEFNKLCVQMKQEREGVVDGLVGEAVFAAGVTRRTAVAAALLAIVAGLVLGFFLARSVTNPVRLVAAGASRIAEGDLTQEMLKVKTRDETGRLADAFNKMLASLREIAGQLKEKAQNLAASAAQLSASADQVSAGAGETASSATQVAHTVEQVARGAQKIAEASRLANSYANEGSAGMDEVRRQMASIEDSSRRVFTVIQKLDGSSQRISQITSLITQIADQTNLLALNAAIEAARAGEHGRGFAVVAEEVRKLAEQSAEAAKEIHALIAEVQQETKAAVANMGEGAEQVRLGNEVVARVGEIFARIIAAVEGLAADIQEIASSAEEMSSAVQNVAAAAEEQTATMEEVSSASQSLSALAGELGNIALKFKLG
ncbi:MAG: methyl-accepting chemotaxis protein [Desulfotomaculales bacterium]